MIFVCYSSMVFGNGGLCKGWGGQAYGEDGGSQDKWKKDFGS
jgi:hypothetical protein